MIYWMDVKLGDPVVRLRRANGSVMGWAVNGEGIYWMDNPNDARLGNAMMEQYAQYYTTINTPVECCVCHRHFPQGEVEFRDWWGRPACSEECNATLYGECEDCGSEVWKFEKKCHICDKHKRDADLKAVGLLGQVGLYELGPNIENPDNAAWFLLESKYINTTLSWAVRERKPEERLAKVNVNKRPYYHKDWVIKRVRPAVREWKLPAVPGHWRMYKYYGGNTLPSAASIRKAMEKYVAELNLDL